MTRVVRRYAGDDGRARFDRRGLARASPGRDDLGGTGVETMKAGSPTPPRP
jgi:hypothetical protein